MHNPDMICGFCGAGESTHSIWQRGRKIKRCEPCRAPILARQRESAAKLRERAASARSGR